MRIVVDGERCSGHGRCYDVAPELLESDEYGYVSIRGSSMEVPEDQRAGAEQAAAWCPEKAITLEDA
jgi:ferredoxin